MSPSMTQLKLEGFCSSYLWDDEKSWNAAIPQFSYCLQDTLLVWIPTFIFIIFLPWEVYRLKKRITWKVDWSAGILLRITTITVIILLDVISLVIAAWRSLTGSFGTSPSEIVGLVISTSTKITALLLTILAKKRGLVTSPCQYYYWLLNSLAELVKYYSAISTLLYQLDNPIFSRLVITLMTFPLSLFIFLLNIFPDKISQQSLNSENLNNVGFRLATASYIMQVTFGWVLPLMMLGKKKKMDKSDVWTLRPSHTTEALYRQFSNQWNKERRSCLKYNRKHPGKNKNPGIVMPLMKSFWSDATFGISTRLVVDSLNYLNPIILNILITFISSDEPTWKGVLYVIAMGAIVFSKEAGTSHYYDKQISFCLRIKGCLTMAIYKKGLALSSSARRNYSIGSMVNLLAVDLQKFQDLVLFIPQLLIAPVVLTIGLIQLWGVLGVSCLSGIGIILICLPYTYGFSRKQNYCQGHVMTLSDQRLKITNEILSGVKVLKLYAWEDPFQNSIMEFRTKEIKMIIGCIISQSAVDIAWQNIVTLISLASFATYVLIDEKNVLTPNVVFVSIVLFNLIKYPLMLFPSAASSIVESRISINRISKFLNSEELSFNGIHENENIDCQFSIENGYFSWDSDVKDSVLKDINIKVKAGELVAVVGKVGSGKSSLISALLGDMCCQRGTINKKGSVAYVPQVAWIQNSTLQENIVFSSAFDRKKYEKIVQACALQPDFDIMIAGDQTEVGEKGVNISGGQKQRISLARAVYADSDVYLFDDTLSAVDAHVGAHIYKEVIGREGLLKSKTRFLSTNSLKFLPECHQIIVLDNGTISESGTYRELIQNSGSFADLILQYASEEKDKEANEEGLQKLEAFQSILDDENILEKLKRGLSQEVHEIENRKARAVTRSTSIERSLDEKITSKKQGKLIEEEEMETGSVNIKVYWMYFRQLGFFLAVGSLLSYFISEGTSVYSNMWLSDWAEESTTRDGGSKSLSIEYWLGIYAALSISSVLGYVSALGFICFGHIKACANLHRNMLDAILKAPMGFFDTTPLGRIINRFSKDVNTMDLRLLFYIKLFMAFLSKVAGALITIVIQIPLVIIAFIPMSILYYFTQNVYLKSSRQLKRIESITRSPIFSFFSESVTGASIIRAYRVEEVFSKNFRDRVDINQTAFYVGFLSARWFEVSSAFIASALVLFTALFSVLYRASIDPSAAGLAVTYALSITFFVNSTIQMASFIETNIVAVERILEYTNITPEAPWKIPGNKPKLDWPQRGIIEFKNYKTKYRNDLPLVLKGISFQTKPGEKIGICGRTGAGKSSLTLALFRIIEGTSGDIILDSVNISRIGLHDLRSRLTIIPQDPVLFTGNLRFNLDPLQEHTDDEVWAALELSHLKAFVLSLEGGLNSKVSEGGENISVGQRQLVCLARALLRRTKVLILDEATAAVDLQTDDLIQETIRKQFSDCTIVTIAHRLNTIMDSSRIVVLSDGEIAELGTPAALLENTNSIFHGMVKDVQITNEIK